MRRLALPALVAVSLPFAACTSEPDGPSPRDAALPAAVAAVPDGSIVVGSFTNGSVVHVGTDGHQRPVASYEADHEVAFRLPSGVAAGPDDTIYLAQTLLGRIAVASLGGDATTLEALAGTDSSPLSYPTGIAVGPDGTVFVSDTDRHVVVATDDNGPWQVVAGGGGSGFSGDGGPAADARLALPGPLAAAADGSVYVADTGNLRIRRVAPDGTISTVAGSNRLRFSGDGGAATGAGIGAVRGLAVAADGTIYLSAAHRVRAVDPSGTISTLAGGDSKGCTGDGGPAVDARLAAPLGLALADDGTLYVADFQNRRVRAISTDGTIDTVVEFPGAPSCD